MSATNCQNALEQEKCREIAAKYSVKHYSSLQEVLEDSRVEAVILMTGPAGRASLVDKIISTGRAVMTTKPFDTSSAQTLRVLQKAEKLHIPVFMNSPEPVLRAELAQIKRWEQQFSLGRTVAYRAGTWCSYREKADGSWYDDPALCPAAPVYRLGIYLLNDLSAFFAPVKNVYVQQSRLFTERPTADTAQLSLQHTDGTLGTIFASFCIQDEQYYRCSMEINYERGTVYRNVGPAPVGGKDTVELSVSAHVNGQRVVEKEEFAAGGAGYQWKNFYKAVRGEKCDVVVTPQQVASVIRIMEEMAKQANE